MQWKVPILKNWNKSESFYTFFVSYLIEIISELE